MKSGYLTSEFLFAVVVVIAATFALVTHNIGKDDWTTALSVATGAYSISRGLAKVKQPTDVDTSVDEPLVEG